LPPTFDKPERTAAALLLDCALEEDLRGTGDLTCRALIDENDQGRVHVVARTAGVLAGEPIAHMVFKRLDPAVTWETQIADGSPLESGSIIATVSGPLRALLTGERTALNFLTHLSGIATLTRNFVHAAVGTKAIILDTRKTLPGYRALHKYAVRAGGGTNHRMGLYDGVLIKDNHLAAWCRTDSGPTIADAIAQARKSTPSRLSIVVEVDTLEQLTDALDGPPDIVLLDNMDCSTLREAVAIRDKVAPTVLLEASGGVSLKAVADIARTGVDRISVGRLTHSAPALDIAFDWPDARPTGSIE
jgi:nicotinate-nucleotide pyrophosphorylase (carboxylating)